jgi:hypothetical protein
MGGRRWRGVWWSWPQADGGVWRSWPQADGGAWRSWPQADGRVGMPPRHLGPPSACWHRGVLVPWLPLTSAARDTLVLPATLVWMPNARTDGGRPCAARECGVSAHQGALDSHSSRRSGRAEFPILSMDRHGRKPGTAGGLRWEPRVGLRRERGQGCGGNRGPGVRAGIAGGGCGGGRGVRFFPHVNTFYVSSVWGAGRLGCCRGGPGS